MRGVHRNGNKIKDIEVMREKTMALSVVDAGKNVILIDIEGGRGIRSKLYSMGLVPGAKLTVLNQNVAGPIMINIKNSKLAIGQGIAQKIIVE